VTLTLSPRWWPHRAGCSPLGIGGPSSPHPQGGSALSGFGALAVALMALSLSSPCPRSGVRRTLPPRHRLWTEALRGEAAEPHPGACGRLRCVPTVAKRRDSPPHPHGLQGLGAGTDLLPWPCQPQGPAATPTRVLVTSRALGTGPPTSLPSPRPRGVPCVPLGSTASPTHTLSPY